MIFDPFGRAERVIGTVALHRIIRYGAAILCGVIVLYQIVQLDRYQSVWLWAAETAVYAVVLVAYLTRDDPIDRSRGSREILLPVIATVLPFGLLVSPVHPNIAGDPTVQHAIFWFMTGGTGFTVWGLWHLRRHFSITVEARGVVTSGPYRFVRHPVYLGEILAAGAVMVWRFSIVSLIFWFVFVSLQLVRARMEEQKLKNAIAAYADYANRRWWFWQYR